MSESNHRFSAFLSTFWLARIVDRRVRGNSNILTRRLCRNRSCDDNELYRSNSFKFERFRRDDVNEAAAAINTLPKQVSGFRAAD